MNLYTIGLAVSGFFAIIGVVFLLLGIYFDFDAHNSYDPLPSSRLSLKYELTSAVSFGLAFFVFLTNEIGLSWDSIFGPVGLVVLTSSLIILGKFIHLKTENYLYNQKISFRSLWNNFPKKGNKINNQKQQG